jgi:Tol biopolymer transport system component
MKRIATSMGCAGLLVLLCALWGPSPAGATTPGTNGRIAYSRFAGQHADIVSVNPDGTSVLKLTSGPAGTYDFNPDWSPNGTNIVFQRDNDSDFNCGQACIQGIYTVKPDGTQVTRLTPDDPGIYSADPSFSPDGMRIAFDRCIGPIVNDTCTSEGLFVMSADGSNTIQVTFENLSSPFQDGEVQWSPDGSHFVFQRFRFSDSSIAVFTVRVDGTGFRRLTPWQLDGEHPDWSPDGNLIAFESYGDGAPPDVSTNVFTVRTDGSHLEQVTDNDGGAVNATNPAWSPDGKKIVFVQIPGSGPFGYADIFTMNADGSNARQVTTSTFWDFRPDWGTAPSS